MQAEMQKARLAQEQCIRAALDWYNAMASSSQEVVTVMTMRLLDAIRPIYEDRL